MTQTSRKGIDALIGFKMTQWAKLKRSAHCPKIGEDGISKIVYVYNQQRQPFNFG
jgi:hypothetical protein